MVWFTDHWSDSMMNWSKKLSKRGGRIRKRISKDFVAVHFLDIFCHEFSSIDFLSFAQKKRKESEREWHTLWMPDCIWKPFAYSTFIHKAVCIAFTLIVQRSFISFPEKKLASVADMSFCFQLSWEGTIINGFVRWQEYKRIGIRGWQGGFWSYILLVMLSCCKIGS